MKSSAGRPSRAGIAGPAILLFVLVAWLPTCSFGTGATRPCPANSADLKFGCPIQSPSAGITYKSDVVLVDGGARSIRSMSPDALVWTIDRQAAGAGQLRPGKVMLLTSDASGRVVSLQPDGNNLVVKLAPISLTDIIQNGHLNVDHPLDLRSLSVSDWPAAAGAVSEPQPLAATQPAPVAMDSSDGITTVELPPLRLAAATQPPSDQPTPPSSKIGHTITVGDWDVEHYYDSGPGGASEALGLKVQYKPSAAALLKFGADFALLVNKPHLSLDETITNAALSAAPTVLLQGIQGIGISLYAGISQDGANKKVRAEVPMEGDMPFPVAGIPLIVHFKWTFIVEMALTGNNSTMTAGGQWGVNGPIGIQSGVTAVPSFSVVHSLVESIAGLTVGVSGLVFGAEWRFLIGLGVHELAAVGPYGKYVVSLGVTNGSALGAFVARCHGATLDVKVGIGLGGHISTKLSELISIALPQGAKWEFEAELLQPVWHRAQTVPSVALCGVLRPDLDKSTGAGQGPPGVSQFRL